MTHSSTETPPVGNERWHVAACQRHESYNLPRRFVGSSSNRRHPPYRDEAAVKMGLFDTTNYRNKDYAQDKMRSYVNAAKSMKISKNGTASASDFNLNCSTMPLSANLNNLVLSIPKNSCSSAASFMLSLSLLFKNFSLSASHLVYVIYFVCVFSLPF